MWIDGRNPPAIKQLITVPFDRPRCGPGARPVRNACPARRHLARLRPSPSPSSRTPAPRPRGIYQGARKIWSRNAEEEAAVPRILPRIIGAYGGADVPTKLFCPFPPLPQSTTKASHRARIPADHRPCANCSRRGRPIVCEGQKKGVRHDTETSWDFLKAVRVLRAAPAPTPREKFSPFSHAYLPNKNRLRNHRTPEPSAVRAFEVFVFCTSHDGNPRTSFCPIKVWFDGRSLEGGGGG